MPPPGYEPFLRAICAEPEDDTVRLVYADWLDENGDPERAEFIRLQIEYERTEWSDASLQRYRDLWQANEHTWRAELPAIQGSEWGYFSRGFVSTLHVRIAFRFTENKEAIFSASPVTRLVFKRVGVGELDAILKSSEMRQIEYLSLEVDSRTDLLWPLLTGWPHLTNLRELSVGRYGHPYRLPALTVPEARPFVESSVFSRLKKLTLCGPVRNAVATLLRTRFTVNVL